MKPGNDTEIKAASSVIDITVDFNGSKDKYLIAMSYPSTCGTFNIRGIKKSRLALGIASVKNGKSVNTALTRMIQPTPTIIIENRSQKLRVLGSLAVKDSWSWPDEQVSLSSEFNIYLI